MGCTNDVINARLKTKEDIKTFITEFNNILNDDLYYDEYDVKDIEIEEELNGYHIFFENEPMFCTADGGDITEYFIKEFVKKYPDIHFSMDYFCSYSNCGDVLFIEYEYNGNNTILVKQKNAEQEGIYMCAECEEDFDEPLVFFDEYNENEEYICPECGARNTLEVWEYQYQLILVDGKWIEKENIEE